MVPDPEPAQPAPYAALAIASAALLALELVQLRIFSYAIDPLLVFSAISVALLGLGAGSIAVALRPELARGAVRMRLALSLTALAVATDLGHAVFARTSPRVGYGSAGAMLAGALPVLGVLVVPYFLGGAFLAIAMTRHVRDVGRAYLANLAGSAVGCVLVYPLLRPLGAERIVALLAAVTAWTGFALAPQRSRARLRVALLAIAVGTTAVVPFATRCFPFQPDPQDLYGLARDALSRTYPGRSARAYEPQREYAQWDPVSRVEVYAFPGEFGRVNGSAPMRLFAQDGGAGSLLVNLRDAPALERAFYDASIWGGPYYARPHPASVLAIGLGGGPDILSALHHGVREITGVEINGAAIDLVSGPYANFLGDPYHRAGVRIEHRDGRGFIERSHTLYDVIQLTGADTYSAAAAGAFMFSESYLYTLEAFDRYLRALSPAGVLSVTRFGPESYRVITSEWAALRALGVAHPEQHMVVLGQGISVNVLVTRRAIDRDESRRIVLAVAESGATTERIRIPVYEAMGFGIAVPVSTLYAPESHAPTAHTALIDALAAGEGERALATVPLDLTPVTDDRPFFFQFLALGRIDRWFFDASNPYARGMRAHVTFLAAIALIALLLIVLPVAVARRGVTGMRGIARSLTYFTALGAGYLFVEITLMQKCALFLGHPTYSVATTLFTLLLASGLGSEASARVTVIARGVLVRRATMAIVLLLGVAQLTLHPLFVALLGAPLAVRVGVLVIVTAPLGFVMGVPFPAGLAAEAAHGETRVCWGLAANHFASVIASLVAVPLAMISGFRGVVALAAVAYAVAGVVAPREREIQGS